MSLERCIPYHRETQVAVYLSTLGTQYTAKLITLESEG